MIGRLRTATRLPQRLMAVVLPLLLLAASARAAVPTALRFTTADGLPSNAVHQVVEDRDGYLWFATDDGLARFDGQRFRIWRIEQGLADNQLLAMATDAQDRLWLGTAQGQLMRMSADRSHVERFDSRRYPALAGTSISVVLPAPDGVVWFGTRDAGLFRLGPGHRLRQYLPTANADGLPDRRVEHLALAADGTLWVGTPRGLARWRNGHFLPPPSMLATAPVSALLVDAEQRLWVSGAAGPWRSSDTGRLEPVDAPAGTRALGVSRRGGPWLGEDATIWKSGAAPHSGLSVAPLGSSDMPRFRSALEDRHGSVWLLGRHLGVWRLPPHWQHFAALDQTPPAMPAVSGVHLELDAPTQHLACADGSRWQVDASGIRRLPAGGAGARQWRWDAIGQARPQGPLALHCDAANGVWWGGRHGLARWADGRFEAVSGVEGEVSALHLAADGALWVATPGRVRRYLIQDGLARPGVQIDARQGLPSLRLASLASDVHGALWATSARGLLRLRPREGQVRLYTRSEGMPEAVFNAQLQAAGSTMLAVDGHGRAVRFDPTGLAACRGEPALVVERVQLHRDGSLHLLPSATVLPLRPDDRDIQVSVRLLGAPVQARQQYRFRLCGLDRDWIRVGRSGTRGFPQLPPGEHRLEFQARLADGSWSPTRALLLQVERSGWHHPVLVSARVTAGALLVGGGAWAAVRRVARGRRAQASAQRLSLLLRSAQAKAHYLATLGHEVRTPLTGILGMAELLLSSPLHAAQRQPLERILQGGHALLERVNHALDQARLEAGCAPLHAADFDVAAVHRQWVARQIVPSCRRGTALALCLQLPGDARAHGDAPRLVQLLDAVARVVGRHTGAAHMVLEVAWRPGREGLLWTFNAGGRAAHPSAAGVGKAVPTPSMASLRTALTAAERLAGALGGTLCVHALGSGRWRVQVGLPMPTVAPQPRGRVLLVDEDRQAARETSALLSVHGCELVHAPHALAGLTELAAGRFDLVLVDMELSGIDGPTLIGLLSARNVTAPVLALSRRSATELPERIGAVGGAGILPKPVTATTLRLALQQAGLA